MPIEFACEKCERTLRVPDGSSGKRSQCPACHFEQEVPFVVSLEEPSSRSESGITKQAAANLPPDKVSIPCPNCRHNLICGRELLGTRGQCKKCAHIFTITESPRAAEAAEPAWIFHCPKCRQLFEGREEMRGRKGKCHVCQSVFPIELELAEPKTAPTSAEEDELIVVPESTPTQQAADGRKSSGFKTSAATGSQSASPPSTPTVSPVSPQPAQRRRPLPAIRFQCASCTGIMEVPGETAGLDTACPYCQVVQKIPPKSTVSSTVTSSGSSPSMNTAPQSYAPLSGPRPAANDVFADLSAPVNPYAASSTTAWTGGLQRARREGLTVGNAFSLMFESLMPAWFALSIHFLIAIITSIVMRVLTRMAGKYIGSLGLDREVAITLAVVVLVMYCIFNAFFGAWFTGAAAHTALRAVRKKSFDMGQAMSPEGAFGPAISIALLQMFFGMILAAPGIMELWSPGTIRGMGNNLMLLSVGVVILSVVTLNLTSLSYYAGVDGEETSQALSTSASLFFNRFPVVFGTRLLNWLLTIVLLIPTLGMAIFLPFFMNAAIYQLARSEE